MRGAAMSLTAASGGFVVLLLTVSVVQGQDDWGVTYTSTEICAFKGSTVDIHCTYTYPPRIKGHDTTVERTFWFTKEQNNEPVDLRTDSDYTGRVQYHCGENSCTLTITDLRESDSAEYKFRLCVRRTTQSRWSQRGRSSRSCSPSSGASKIRMIEMDKKHFSQSLLHNDQLDIPSQQGKILQKLPLCCVESWLIVMQPSESDSSSEQSQQPIHTWVVYENEDSTFPVKA
ncbi:B-cell receptor CD22-like protein [Lates japonicus]|uniref:B-cell receptor CD22-like protein n=1 Tax=Lates japonicus TaxID=270547 RepID=A0AAD3R8U8_LATJO|nr:B-cell receptor CD22-like protein [Lates japonicus]